MNEENILGMTPNIAFALMSFSELFSKSTTTVSENMGYTSKYREMKTIFSML